VQNLQKKKTFRDAVKNIRILAATGKQSEAQILLPQAYQALDKAAKTNVIRKTAAGRVKSRLTKLVNKKSASPIL